MKPLCKKASWRVVIYFFIPLLFTACFTVEGQGLPDYHRIDSIACQLKKSRPDSDRVRLLIELSADYLSKAELAPREFDEIFTHLQHADALCDSLGLSFAGWKVKSRFLRGKALFLCNKAAEGKEVFMELVKKAHNAGDRRGEAECWREYARAMNRTYKLVYFRRDAEIAYANTINIYRELKDRKGEIDMTLWIASVYDYNTEFDKAEKLYLSLIQKSEMSGYYSLPLIYLFLSMVNRYTGNYNKALGYALQTIKAMEKSKDSTRAGLCYGELAEVYQALDKPAESAAWYKKCIGKRELDPGYPSFNLYRTYSLLIVQLIKSRQQKEALAIIEDLQKRRPPNTSGESAVFFQSMAYCYDAGNIYDSTEKYFLKTVEAFSRAGKNSIIDDEIILLAHYDMADFYVRHRQFKKARPFLDTLISKPNSFNVSKKSDVQWLLFKIDSASGNYLAAIQHLQQYKALTDSILNEKKGRQIEQLQIEYETEKKDQEIGLLTKKDQLQQANLKQANTLKNWITASAVLLVLLLVVGYNRYRFKQKANSKLEEQQIVINQKNSSLQRLVNEKEWLVKEIHHRVKNNFHIVTGLLGTQSGYLKNEEAIAAIKESRQRIHAMSLIHQKLYQSESLSAIDMPGYVHELVDSLKDSLNKDASIRFHLQLGRINLALSHVIPIGLILNEAITNSFKYAFPGKKEGNINISLVYGAGDNRMVLTVSDDGIGLPAGFDSSRQSSMGISLMKGLSEDIDGKFTIYSNNGTIVTLDFMYRPDLPTGFTPSVSNQNHIA